MVDGALLPLTWVAVANNPSTPKLAQKRLRYCDLSGEITCSKIVIWSYLLEKRCCEDHLNPDYALDFEMKLKWAKRL